MASTYSALKIELIGTGDQSGTWGASTNVNLGTAIEEAITGTVSVPFSSADVTLTLTNSNGSQTARNLRLNLTGTSGGARNLYIPATSGSYAFVKFYIVNNNLANTVTVAVVGTPGTTVAVPAGTSTFVYTDGTDVKVAINYFSGAIVSSSATITGGTITGSTINSTSIGATTASTGAFTTLSASSTVSGTGFSTYLASPPAIGGTAAAAGTFTSGTFTSISDSGNLTFTGTSNRILGDFTNATIANRVAFQTSTTDSNSIVGVLPNGTGTGSALQVYNNSTPTNASLGSWEVSSTAVTIASSIRGSGTYLPMVFNTNGNEQMRITTSGGISFGTSGTGYGTSGQVLQSNGNAAPTWTTISTGSGTVTSVSFTGGIVSVGTATTTPALTIAGTSGGIPYFSSGTAWASSAALASGAIVLGGGAGAAPATTTTGTGVVTALGITINTGSGGLVTNTGTATLTNKRVTTRSLAPVSTTGTVTPASDTYDQVNYSLTGTASFAVPSGTPTDGQKLNIRLYAASTQTVSWTTTSTGYRVIGVTLPTSVAAGKTVYVGCVWNSTDSFWDVVAVATQA